MATSSIDKDFVLDGRTQGVKDLVEASKNAEPMKHKKDPRYKVIINF